MGRPRKNSVVARIEPARPTPVEQAPIRQDIDDVDLRLAVVGKLDASKFEAILLNDVMELPSLTGAVRTKTIERSIRLLEMLLKEGA